MAAYDSYWADLDKDQRQAARSCGWNKNTWDSSTKVPIEASFWSAITPAQQRSLSVLGYSQELWDAQVSKGRDSVKNLLHRFDEDGSGSISYEELGKLLDHLGVSRQEQQSLMELADVNNDGLLDFGEFVNMLFSGLEGAAGAGGDTPSDYEAAQLQDYFYPGARYTRLSEFDPGVSLFGERPLADDVMQGGKSSHCWFLAACTSLAEQYPDYIKSLITDEGNGMFVVSFYSYESSSWIQIEVDNKVPIRDGSLIMAQLGRQKAIWPHILQKAAGRYMGGYCDMDNADPAFAFGMLTGCTTYYYLDQKCDGVWEYYKYRPIQTNKPHDYDWDSHFEDEIEREFPFGELMGIVEELKSNGWPMAASSDVHTISLLRADGQRVLLRDQADAGPDGTEGSWWVDANELAQEYKYITFFRWTP